MDKDANVTFQKYLGNSEPGVITGKKGIELLETLSEGNFGTSTIMCDGDEDKKHREFFARISGTRKAAGK